MSAIGLQSRLECDFARAGLYSWLFIHDGTKPDLHLEVPIAKHGCILDWAHEPCLVSRDESGGGNHSHGCGRRDVEILERIPKGDHAQACSRQCVAVRQNDAVILYATALFTDPTHPSTSSYSLYTYFIALMCIFPSFSLPLFGPLAPCLPFVL